MKSTKKRSLSKFVLRMFLYILLTLIGLLLGLYAVLSIYIEKADPIIGPPSKEIKNLLKDEKFYFMLGGSIYESKGVQSKATLIKKRQIRETSEGVYKVDYFLPTKSPNQKYLAYWEIYSFDQWHAVCCGNNYFIQLVVLNLETGKEKKIFDTDTFRIKNFPNGMDKEEFRISELTWYSIGWKDDSENLYFNFIDKNYIYHNISVDFIPGQIIKSEGLINIGARYIDTCAYPYPPVCLESKDRRFQFFHEEREGLNSVWYIRGHDTVTGENFRLTTLNRALYTE